MDFAYSPKVVALQRRVRDFLDDHVLPADAEWQAIVERGEYPLAVVEPLKELAKSEGLWNLFLPGLRDGEPGTRLTNLEYAPLAEIMGRVPWSSELFNCNAPDTGNMELLHLFATPAQHERWLEPLLEGEIRSCFAMTEPAVASSDATNMEATITADGDDYIVNGTKWFSTGAMDPRCKVAIFMGVSNPDGPKYGRHSMILVPFDAPGVEVVRDVSVFGYHDQHGHPEVRYTDVRVPKEHLIAQEGAGFMIAQARLGPGRVHHCMRAIGMSERALELMVERVLHRNAFGGPLARQGVIREWIAESRMEIDQARLLVLKAAWMMDTVGNKHAMKEIAAIKVVAARLACRVLDRAIQAHGGAGVTGDFPLAALYAGARTLRLADGPDEVHLRSVARLELAGQ